MQNHRKQIKRPNSFILFVGSKNEQTEKLQVISFWLIFLRINSNFVDVFGIGSNLWSS